MRLLQCLLVFSCLMPVLAMQSQSKPSEVGTVGIEVVDTFGVTLPGAAIVLTEVGPGHIIKKNGGIVKFVNVPFGVYEITVQLPGFSVRKERLRLCQSRVDLHVGLELGEIHSSERSQLVGNVRGTNGNSGVWVRLVALYSDDTVENAVTALGIFELAGMSPGKYLLMLLDKDKVVMSQPVTILPGKQTVELSMGSVTGIKKP